MTPKKASDGTEPPDGLAVRHGGSSATDSGECHLLPLVDDPGNRRVLREWVQRHENYRLASDETDVLTGEFDCLIVDRPSLVDHRESLIERKNREGAILPIVLLVEESEAASVRQGLREEHPELSEAINAVVTMPIAEHRFADRIETLLQVRRQSRELSVQRRQLRAIRDEHAGHGVVITDREGTIQYVNKAFEQQSGYETETVIGENPRILNSGEHDDSFFEEMWETILDGEVWHGEVINERKDGEQYVLNQTVAPITNSEGEIERFIAVNHEITRLKDLQSSLRSQREELEILNRVLRHDIRNDLNVILGWMGVLDEHVDSDGQDYIDRITHSAEHIVELTNVAADLVGDITADSDPELEPVDISHVLGEEVEKRREAFGDATIELHDTVPPDTHVWANSMLASVFRNLINNAVQHNDSADPRVEIHSEMGEESVVIRVADNGPGIPDGKKEQMFAKSHKGLDSEGTGMGLYLVQALVETFDGEVWIEDNEPEGAVFTVELPTVAEHPDPLESQQ